jgi:hypothetical protein
MMHWAFSTRSMAGTVELGLGLFPDRHLDFDRRVAPAGAASAASA